MDVNSSGVAFKRYLAAGKVLLTLPQVVIILSL
jgi:hypothetical protein